MAQPLISIITISYNCADAIEKTIRSVLSQRYTDFEYIIIDGGSTDGTADIICRHNPHLAYWVSEKDKGISDAFNKGIAAAKGKYINLLNAGDSFASIRDWWVKVRSILKKKHCWDTRPLLSTGTYMQRWGATMVAIRSGWTLTFFSAYCLTMR